MKIFSKKDAPPDSQHPNKLIAYVPLKWRPYALLARWERPIGWWLLFLPCSWSILLAYSYQKNTPDTALFLTDYSSHSQWSALFLLLFLFWLGSVLMRGAGCTFNDLIDRNIDKQVERTQSRPLASGALTVRPALIFLLMQLLLSLFILRQLHPNAQMLGMLAILPVFIYPFMKRITYWPQFFLGIAFNWGIFIGWASVVGSIHMPAYLLFIAGVGWTLIYDTIYAHQDKEDDLLVGVKSSAIKLGDKTGIVLALLLVVVLLCLGAVGWICKAGAFYYVGLVAAGVHGLWQLIWLDINDPARCLRLFRSNRDFGFLILAGIFFDAFFN